MDRGSNGVGLTTGAHYRQAAKQGRTFFVSAKIDEVQTFVATTSLIGEGKRRMPGATSRTTSPSGRAGT